MDNNHGSSPIDVHFVESLPLGLSGLQAIGDAESTAEALIRLTHAARSTIDLTAMYWALRPDTTSQDEKGWSERELLDEYGADRGVALYEALEAAASRSVEIRIIESPGFDNREDPPPTESERLEAEHGDLVRRRSIAMPDWYGSGIMHQKVWVFDGRAVYIGSANMDWKSLTQVKEIGIVVEDDPVVAAEVTRYYDTWWTFAGLEAKGDTITVFDPASQVRRKVPAWSPLAETCAPNPLDDPALRTTHSWESPLPWTANGEPGHLVLSGAPLEVCVGDRTFDGDVLVETISNAETSVCISVMDWAPISLYQGDYDANTGKYMKDGEVASPVWWPALIDALLGVVMAKKVHARLLVSDWAHTSPFVTPLLESLAGAAAAAHASPSLTSGTLEIRHFVIPGADSTGPRVNGASPGYPGHTRVNHTKYIVTDSRINIGTSNMTWDYFHGTAGTSFNATQPGLVSRLQEIFDRDWGSQYAHALGD